MCYRIRDASESHPSRPVLRGNAPSARLPRPDRPFDQGSGSPGASTKLSLHQALDAPRLFTLFQDWAERLVSLERCPCVAGSPSHRTLNRPLRVAPLSIRWGTARHLTAFAENLIGNRHRQWCQNPKPAHGVAQSRTTRPLLMAEPVHGNSGRSFAGCSRPRLRPD